MAYATGANTQIVIAKEASYKGDPSGGAVKAKIPFRSESIRLSRNLMSSQAIFSNRNPLKPVHGNIDVAGDLVVELTPYFTMLLYGALGSINTSGTGPYTHTIKVGSTLPSFKVEKGFTDIGKYFLYSGCKVSSLRFDFSPEGFQIVTVSFVGANEVVSTSSFASSPTTYTYDPFTGFEATINEGGSELGVVTAIRDLTINNNLDTNVYTFGSEGERYDLPEGVVAVSGTLTAFFESVDLYNKAVGGTETSLVITFIKGTGSGSAGNEKLVLTIPELLFSPRAPVISGRGGVLIELPFEGYYSDNTDQSTIKIEVYNTQSTVV